MRSPFMLAALLCAAPLAAQQRPVEGPLRDYLRVRELLPADSAHPWSARRVAAAPPPARVALTDAALLLFSNSRVPSGMNDGAVWQGRGVTLALDAGAAARFGPLTVQLRPRAIYTQNRGFDLYAVTDTARTPFASGFHPYNGGGGYVDLPQRFGPDAFWTLDPGQTFVRLDWRGAAVGVSAENRWWGPAIQNAIMLSNNAPGFPHAFLATGRPVDIGIGRFAAEWIWGRLTPSDWTWRAPRTVRRFITGATATVQPDLLPGLTLGAERIYYFDVPAGGVTLGDWLLVLQGVTKKGLADSANPGGDDVRDQMGAVFAQWAFPQAGFEAYVEWGRNDHAWDIRDLSLEPEHSQAYTIGFQQVVRGRGGRLLRVAGELTHLERSNTVEMRATPTWYVHHTSRDGYTQRGQVIGAGIGPGGNAQYLGMDLLDRWGRAGLYWRRQVHDNDAHRNIHPADWNSHDVTVALGARGLVFAGPWDVEGTLEWQLERNRYWLYNRDVRNLHFELGLRWRP